MKPAQPSPWRDTLFVCSQWSRNQEAILLEGTDDIAYPQPAHPAPPGVIRSDPPTIETLRVKGLEDTRPLAWSADGTWLALWAAGPEGNLYALDGPRSTARPLAPQAVVQADWRFYTFSWSPVGARFFVPDSSGQAFVGDAAKGTTRDVGTAGCLENLTDGPFQPPYLPTPVAWTDGGSCVAWLDREKHLVHYDLEAENLHTSNLSPTWLAWAPGGRTILTVRDGPAAPVVRYDAPQPPPQVARHAILTLVTGRETELLTEGPPSGRLRSSPTWSPDGRWLALTIPRGHADSDLIVWDEQGERIATRPHVITFAWRPDSSGLVYVREGGEMWLLPVTPEGGDQRRVSDAYAVTPRRAPPGRMLCRTPSWSLGVLDLEALEMKEFTGVQVDPKRWSQEICEPSPDGTKLVVFQDVTAAPGMVGNDRVYDLFVCDLVTGAVRTHRLRASGSDTRPSYLQVAVAYGSWSGDGRFILLRGCPRDGGWGLVNADTGRLTQLPGYTGGQWMARHTAADPS